MTYEEAQRILEDKQLSQGSPIRHQAYLYLMQHGEHACPENQRKESMEGITVGP